MYSWSSWHTLVPFLIGAVGLIAFVVYEEKWALNPLIPMIVFKNRTCESMTTFYPPTSSPYTWGVAIYVSNRYQKLRYLSSASSFTVSPYGHQYTFGPSTLKEYLGSLRSLRVLPFSLKQSLFRPSPF